MATNASNYHRITFAARARTYESPTFIADLIRLAVVDDCIAASSALELAAAIVPPSTGAVVRDLLSRPDVSSATLARLVSIALPSKTRDFEPIPIPPRLAGTLGLVGLVDHAVAAPLSTTSGGDEQQHENASVLPAYEAARQMERWEVFVDREQDRLRGAVVDLALRGAASLSPSLTMWLCGFPSAAAAGAATPFVPLPAWVRDRAFGSNSSSNNRGSEAAAAIAPNHLLDAVLAALNHRTFGGAKPLLVAKYAKLLAQLLSNPATNAGPLHRFLQARDGLDFIKSLYHTMGGASNLRNADADNDDFEDVTSPVGRDHHSRVDDLVAGSDDDMAAPSAVYRAAYTMRILVLELFHAASSSSSSSRSASTFDASTYGGSSSRAVHDNLNAFVLHHVRALMAPSTSLRARHIAADAGHERVCTLGAWLISALHAAPPMPSTPSFALRDSSALIVPQQGNASDATDSGCVDPFEGAPTADAAAPFYDISRVYALAKEAEAALPESQRRTPTAWRELLDTYVAVNRAFRAQTMVSTFAEAWCQLLELIATAFNQHVSVANHVALLDVLLVLLPRIGDSGVFKVKIRDSLSATVARAVATLVASLHVRVCHTAAAAAETGSVLHEDANEDDEGPPTQRAGGEFFGSGLYGGASHKSGRRSGHVGGTSPAPAAASTFDSAASTGLLTRLLTLLLQLGAVQMSVGVKHSMYAAILGLLRVSSTHEQARIDADACLRLGGDGLFARMSVDATNAALPQSTRVLALRCLQLLMAGGSTDDAAMLDSIVPPTAHGATSAALASFISGAVALLDANMSDVVARGEPALAVGTAEWAEALGAVLDVLADRRPRELAGAGLPRLVVAMTCWPALGAAVISDADAAGQTGIPSPHGVTPATASSNFMGGIAGYAAGLAGLDGAAAASGFTYASMPVIVSARVFAVFFQTFGTLCARVRRHQAVPGDIAAFAVANRTVLCKVLAAPYAAAASNVALAARPTTPLSSPLFLPIRLVSSATQMLLQLTQTALGPQMAPLCAQLQLTAFLCGLSDVTRQVLNHSEAAATAANVAASASTPLPAARPSALPRTLLKYLLTSIAATAAALLAALCPSPEALVAATEQQCQQAHRTQLGALSPSPTAGRLDVLNALDCIADIIRHFAHRVATLSGSGSTHSGADGATGDDRPHRSSRASGAAGGGQLLTEARGHENARAAESANELMNIAIRGAETAAMLLQIDLTRSAVGSAADGSAPLDDAARERVVNAANVVRRAAIDGAHAAAVSAGSRRHGQHAAASSSSSANQSILFRDATMRVSNSAADDSHHYATQAPPVGHIPRGSIEHATAQSVNDLDIILQSLVKASAHGSLRTYRRDGDDGIVRGWNDEPEDRYGQPRRN